MCLNWELGVKNVVVVETFHTAGMKVEQGSRGCTRGDCRLRLYLCFYKFEKPYFELSVAEAQNM